jgi:hypothetical protein
MGLGIANLLSRVRILVTATTHEEEGYHPWMVFLEILLGIAGIITRPPKIPERGVMAGVAKHQRSQFIVGRIDAEHGDSMIDGAIRHRVVQVTLLRRCPPIHGKTAAGMGIRELGRG